MISFNLQHPGMGPGRRIYMAIYMGSVVYTSFLCLFAVSEICIIMCNNLIKEDITTIFYLCISQPPPPPCLMAISLTSEFIFSSGE